ncbi:ATP-dependent nuclease [Agrobacterium radiobacter]|uniref:ATP-dependent nuclease n=1 Tax=Agrobacterium radiobacter TaxID=362 RepID=UPI003F86A1FD
MKLNRIHLRNFRRLEDVEIGFEESDTVLVGPNNSGKTSASTAFRLFLGKSDFKVHDFSVSKIFELDAFGQSQALDLPPLPKIEMDLWFSFNTEVEFGRVFSLLPSNVDMTSAEVGIRISFSVLKKNVEVLRKDYDVFFPPLEEGKRKTLSHFLSLDGHLTRYYSMQFYALEAAVDGLKEIPLDPQEGKDALRSILRIDFVDAQRNIDDQEAGRSNKLSTAFGAFYKYNLEQKSISEEANLVIDENNTRLSEHYKVHFTGLMGVIQSLGFPSINDRTLEIVSTLSPEAALKGNTTLLYLDADLNHRLPEAYNGLGFKNLVYMAIQVSHFHTQWMNTAEQRPLCHLIFIEEPEAHLHAQVQQTFVANIWQIVKQAATASEQPDLLPQLVISTHSSHMLERVDFGKVRYFKKCHFAGQDKNKIKGFHASTVQNLRKFKPDEKSAAGVVEDEEETLKFLKKYLRLTHCDLFFADAAILIEGSAEKLLMSEMIAKSAQGLNQKYISVLEVGGAYASRFASLMKFLGIPYLVLTDIDAVDPKTKRSACRADLPGAVTSNSSLSFFFNETAIDKLSVITKDQQVLHDGSCMVAFQKPTPVGGYSAGKTMHGRTFEEAFTYQNLDLFKTGKIELGVTIPSDDDHDLVHRTIFERVQSKQFKKTEFALNVASSSAGWETPTYISEGLDWLDKRLSSTNSGGAGQ